MRVPHSGIETEQKLPYHMRYLTLNTQKIQTGSSDRALTFLFCLQPKGLEECLYLYLSIYPSIYYRQLGQHLIYGDDLTVSHD